MYVLEIDAVGPLLNHLWNAGYGKPHCSASSLAHTSSALSRLYLILIQVSDPVFTSKANMKRRREPSFLKIDVFDIILKLQQCIYTVSLKNSLCIALFLTLHQFLGKS